MPDKLDEINSRNLKFFLGLGFPVWGSWYPSVPLVCSKKNFPAGCAQDTGKTTVLSLAAHTLETCGILHDSIVRYP